MGYMKQSENERVKEEGRGAEEQLHMGYLFHHWKVFW